MPYPTVVTDSAANADRINQFRDFSKSLPDPAQPQIDADVAAYNAHVQKLGDVTQPTTPSASPSSSAAVSSSAAAPSSGPIDSSSREAFIRTSMPYAQAWEAKTGIPASYFIAIGASESNWGKAGGNELFGIKGSGNAGSLNTPTWESVNGQRVNINDNFAAYNSVNDAYQGFWDLLQNQRYAPALAVLRNGGSGYDFTRALNDAGYATDPIWAEKIRSIAQNQIEPVIGASPPRGAQAPYPQGLGDQNVGQAATAQGAGGYAQNDQASATSNGQGSFVPHTAGGSAGLVQSQPSALNDGFEGATLGGTNLDEGPQPPSPNNDLKEFSAYASSLGDPGGISSFGSNPQDATSPIDQARSQGQTGLPDFAGMASSALGSVGGLVASMLPKPPDQGFSLPSSNSAGPQPYNDMAGSFTPAFGANPEDATSPIEQNRVSNPPTEASPFTLDWPSVTVPTTKKKPAMLPQLLAGESPLTDLGNQIVLGQQGRMANQRYAFTPTLGTRADQPAREQVQRDRSLTALYTPSQSRAQDEAVQNMVIGTVGEVPEGAGKLLGPAADAAKAGVTRMFHGTGSSFGVPDAAKFDPNGLFGPGYYLTSDARVAGSYATGGRSPLQLQTSMGAFQRQLEDAEKKLADPNLHPGYRVSLERQVQILKDELSKGGAQTRAVNVPNNLKLLDADGPIESQAIRSMANVLPEGNIRQGFINRALPEANTNPMMRGQNTGPRSFGDVYAALEDAVQKTRFKTGSSDDPKLIANNLLQSAGYDGIQYAGGKRIPMVDDAGAPIEHTAVVIFPESMGKLTNAISGTRFGSPPAVGGAIVGGLAGSQQGDTPEERARNALLGAAAGGVGGHLLGSGQLGRLASDESGMIGRAPKAAAKPGEGRAGNILLKKYVPEEVRQVITDSFAANPEAAEAARRGVVSDTTVRELADAAGTTVNKVIDRWKPGDAANAESILSMRQALSAKSQEVLDAQKAVQGGNTTANLLTLQLKLKEQQAIQQAVTGVSAEAGRALRQFRQEVDGAIGSQDSRMMEALLKKMGGREWTEEMAQRLGQLDPDDPAASFKFIRSLSQPSVNDKLTEFWYNAILSSPTTHLSNLISNTVSAVMGPIESAVAAGVEAPLAALQGRPRGRFFGEVKPEVIGMLQGFPEGVQKALYTMKNGFSLDDAVRMDLRKTQALKGPVGDVINTPSRLLAASDTMGQAVLYSAKKNALAFRTAASEGLKGTTLADRAAFLSQNPTPKMMEEAGKLAEYRLFRQAPGAPTQKLIELRNAQIFGGTPIRYVIPFIQTPVNLFKFGLERSPLGWFNPALWGKTGAVARHDPAAADMLARAFMGSMVSAAIAAKFGSGEITGAAPTSPSERDAFYRQGKQPYSMRIGDQWISYQKMEPFNQDFMMIAGVVDAIRDNKAGTDSTTAALKVGTTVAKGLVSQTYLSGLSDVLDALNDPDRYGAKFAERFVGSMVPFSSLGRTVVRATDPTIRTPDSIGDAVKSNIPGLSQQVPSKLNAFGQESKREGSPISPYNVSSAKTTDVESELARLRVEPGFVGNSAHGIDLTPAEHRQYQQKSGELMLKKLTDYIGSDEWRGNNDAQRGKNIRRLIQEARDRAGHDILDAIPPDEFQRRKSAQAVGAR